MRLQRWQLSALQHNGSGPARIASEAPTITRSYAGRCVLVSVTEAGSCERGGPDPLLGSCDDVDGRGGDRRGRLPLLGVWLRFGLSLEPFVVWLSLFTALYVLTCIGEIGSRRLWRDTVTDEDDEGDENA